MSVHELINLTIYHRRCSKHATRTPKQPFQCMASICGLSSLLHKYSIEGCYGWKGRPSTRPTIFFSTTSFKSAAAGYTASHTSVPCDRNQDERKSVFRPRPRDTDQPTPMRLQFTGTSQGIKLVLMRKWNVEEGRDWFHHRLMRHFNASFLQLSSKRFLLILESC